LIFAGNEHHTQMARNYWVKTDYQQFCKLLYWDLICLVHVAQSMLVMLMCFFFTAEAVTNTAHCMYLRAGLSSLQLIFIMIF